MSRSCLWYLIVWLRFYSVDKVRKFNSVLNKKYGHIIAYQVIIAFLGIKLYSKTTYIAR